MCTYASKGLSVKQQHVAVAQYLVLTFAMCKHMSFARSMIASMPVGGEGERERAYDEAMDAIFNQKVKAHRHMQAYVSHKTGKTKWQELEMWPVMVRSFMHTHT